jgi:hypothetical protein
MTFRSVFNKLRAWVKQNGRITVVPTVAAASTAFQYDTFAKFVPMKEDEINSFILHKADAKSIQRGVVHSYHTNQFNANPVIEDTFNIQQPLSAANGMLVGVFDGHRYIFALIRIAHLYARVFIFVVLFSSFFVLFCFVLFCAVAFLCFVLQQMFAN